jgi:hypothetical protein
MSAPSPAQPDEDTVGKAQKAERIVAVIAASVIRDLGRPTDLFRVAVVRLWKNHYRVNVHTGADAVSVRVAHSYFLTTDENGQVLASAPLIARVY